MTCLNENSAELLLAYFDGALPEAERLALDAHAAQCADCRALLSVHTQLDDFTTPEVSSDFDTKLYARIAAEEARPLWHFSNWLHVSNWKLVIPITAVAAMLAVGVFVAQRSTAVEHGPTQLKSQTQPTQIELEQALDDLELLMPLNSAQL